MKFNIGDIVLVTKEGVPDRRARVLGQARHHGGPNATELWPGHVDITFDDGKPYRTYAEDDLELAPVTRVGTERFRVDPDGDSRIVYRVTGDEGTDLRADRVHFGRYGEVTDARVDGRTFVRDEQDLAERTYIEVA